MNILKDYQDFLRLKKRSEKTIKYYMTTAELLFDVIGEEKKIEEWTMSDLQKFLVFLDNKNYANGTFNKYVNAFNSFMKYVITYKINTNVTREDIDTTFELKEVETYERGEQPLRTDEYIPFINYVASLSNGKILRQRQIVAVLLMSTTGLRRFEISNLLRSDLDLDNNCIDPSTTKFGKKRGKILKLQKVVVDQIKELYKLYEESEDWVDNKEYVFISKQGKNIGENKINGFTETIALKAVKDKVIQETVTPHGLRKSYATYLYEVVGWSMAKIMVILGQKQESTTQIYILGNERQMEEDMQDLDFFN